MSAPTPRVAADFDVDKVTSTSSFHDLPEDDRLSLEKRNYGEWHDYIINQLRRVFLSQYIDISRVPDCPTEDEAKNNKDLRNIRVLPLTSHFVLEVVYGRLRRPGYCKIVDVYRDHERARFPTTIIYAVLDRETRKPPAMHSPVHRLIPRWRVKRRRRRWSHRHRAGFSVR
jgi:hypothetical protein